MNQRDTTRKICAGGLAIGGGAPVTMQSMCNTKTWDVEATVAQIRALRAAGCDIVRLAVPDMPSAMAISAHQGARGRSPCGGYPILTTASPWSAPRGA